MKSGTLILALCELGPLLKAHGYITPDGEFDETKFTDLLADAQLTTDLLARLATHGIVLPPDLTKIVKAAPEIIAALPWLLKLAQAIQ